MRLLDEILAANKAFLTANWKVSEKPRRKVAIFTCMDTRLVELLEPAMGISRGDAHIIKNAGNILVDPKGGVVRSLVVSVYTLAVEEILVVGHQDCGMAKLSISKLEHAMLARGISPSILDDIQGLHDWIGAFADPADNVRKVVRLIRASPMLPNDVPIHGLLIEPESGALTLLINGYSDISTQ